MRQVGYLQELYLEARSTKYKIQQEFLVQIIKDVQCLKALQIYEWEKKKQNMESVKAQGEGKSPEGRL